MKNKKSEVKSKTRLKVAVVMGGMSSEHEISMVSGKSVVNSLSSEKYDVFPIIISKENGGWFLSNRKELSNINTDIDQKEDKIIKKYESGIETNFLSKKGIDVIFIALHGPNGEDGSIQGMFDLLGVPYTGSGVLASAIGMDKIIFRKLMTHEKLPIPKYIVVKRGDNFKNIHKTLRRKPYFVKPYNQGSSVGASLVKKEKDLGKALKFAHKYSDLALVDEYIKGKEITCAVLGNSKPIPLPLVEIVTKNDFFDYQAKYSESGAQEISPARVGKRITKKIQDLAVKVYKVLGCKGFARVDFILKDNTDPVILEINTIPGLTPMSLLPKAALAAGVDYASLIERIIKYAVK